MEASGRRNTYLGYDYGGSIGRNIENTATHIKDTFVGKHGDCGCNPKKENCRMMKAYTIDGELIEKCGEHVFVFGQPTMEKLPDYAELLRKFYPIKKSTSAV